MPDFSDPQWRNRVAEDLRTKVDRMQDEAARMRSVIRDLQISIVIFADDLGGLMLKEVIKANPSVASLRSVDDARLPTALIGTLFGIEVFRAPEFFSTPDEDARVARYFVGWFQGTANAANSQ